MNLNRNDMSRCLALFLFVLFACNASAMDKKELDRMYFSNRAMSKDLRVAIHNEKELMLKNGSKLKKEVVELMQKTQATKKKWLLLDRNLASLKRKLCLKLLSIGLFKKSEPEMASYQDLKKTFLAECFGYEKLLFIDALWQQWDMYVLRCHRH